MKKLVLTIVVFCAGIALYAQPQDGNPGGAPAPLGGISLLIAAGAAYGGKKAYDVYKKRDEVK